MAHGVRRIEPDEKVMMLAEVAATRRISPSFQRVTLSGPGLTGFTPLGFDQWFRMFLPQPGAAQFPLPRSMDLVGYARFLLIPKRERPTMRNYTVRAFRPATPDSAAELDVDFVLHGDHGVASRWAEGASPGDRVAILDEGVLFVPPADTRRYLVVSDETGLPAVAGIAASLDADAEGDIILEVPDASDAEELNLPAGLALHLIPRDPGVAPGLPALARLTSLDLDTEGLYAFAIGESGLATGTRRYLVGERGLPKSRISFCGFWKNSQ